MGIQLQKLSLMQHPDDVSPWRQVKWVLGFYLIFSGSLIDFLAFGLAPQSLLAPLAALTLIWNIFMSSRFLGETYTRFDIYATATIFFGTVVTIIYADHKEETFTLEELKALYRRTKMVTYSVLMPLFIGTHYAGTVFIGRAQAEQPPRWVSNKWKQLQMVCYAGFAGSIGGQSLLFAKSTVELIKDAIAGQGVFKELETYVIMGMMVFCLYNQIMFLNGGLKRFDALYVVPVYQAYWIISGTLGGLVYFKEFDTMTNAAFAAFVFGVSITIGGVLLLTKSRPAAGRTQSGGGGGGGGPYEHVNLEADEDEEEFARLTAHRSTGQGIEIGALNDVDVEIDLSDLEAGGDDDDLEARLALEDDYGHKKHTPAQDANGGARKKKKKKKRRKKKGKKQRQQEVELAAVARAAGSGPSGSDEVEL